MAPSLFPNPTTATCLPPFRTLLIAGCYPASSPIHIAVSHLRDESTACAPHKKQRVLLITPSRSDFSSALEAYNDQVLNVCAGHGEFSHVLSEVDILYAPTPAHLTLLLSMLHIPCVENWSASPKDPKTSLHIPPSLLILHELSSYFSHPEIRETTTVSAYLALVANALAALRYITHQSNDMEPRLALFDSKIQDLKLPLIKPLSMDELIPEDYGESSSRKESVLEAAKHYFEWVGIVESASDPQPMNRGDVEATNSASLRMTLTSMPRIKLGGNPSHALQGDALAWEWSVKEESLDWGGRRGAVIVWE